MVKWICIDLEGKILSFEDAEGTKAWDIEQKEGIALLAEIALLLDIFDPKGLEEEIRSHL